MDPRISEFSYGFALTRELIEGLGEELLAAPVFPSLYDEGKPGGGWDVKLDQPGSLLFLQFKLSHCMVRTNCKEAAQLGFSVPCYRVYLRKAPSQQHQMLLDLEASGEDVYYVAPGFHEAEELNDAYLAKSVRSRSRWVRPTQIGMLPPGQHHVLFHLAGGLAIFSEPRLLEGDISFESARAHVRESLRRRDRSRLGDQLGSVAERIASISAGRSDIPERAKDNTRAKLSSAPPLHRIVHYAGVFLESQVLVVQERS